MKKVVIFLILAIAVLTGTISCSSTMHNSHSSSNGQHSGGCH